MFLSKCLAENFFFDFSVVGFPVRILLNKKITKIFAKKKPLFFFFIYIFCCNGEENLFFLCIATVRGLYIQNSFLVIIRLIFQNIFKVGITYFIAVHSFCREKEYEKQI